MKNLRPSTKRALIDKANSTILIVTSVAAFVIVFSLIASKSLVSQMLYQNTVIGKKQTALNQLEADINARDSLKTAYDEFVSQPTNVVGGANPGTGDGNEGDNAKIILDALPSKYDFPALVTSLEKLINGQDLSIGSITGTDDEVTQSANQSSPKPVAVPMPFTATVSGSYDSVKKLVDQFEHSIRPFQIQTLSMSGDDSEMTFTLGAQTFYQPGKTFKITKEVVQP